MTDHIARATALYREGRYDEAEQELRPELEASPDDLTARALLSLCRSARTGTDESVAGLTGAGAIDAVTYADRGWALLRAADARAALDSFREALRLDPELEFARAGAAEAVEAVSWVRRQALAGLRRLGHLGRFQWVLLAGFLVVSWAAGAVAERYPVLERAVGLLAIGCLAAVFGSSISGPLSDVVLGSSRFGRLTLSRERRVVANWMAGCLAGLLAWVGFGLFAPSEYAHLWKSPAIAFFASLLPVSFVNACRPGWPRLVMTICAGALTAVVLTGTGLFVAALSLVEQDRHTASSCYRLGRQLFVVGFWASLATFPLSLWLAIVRPRK
jgi:tetratricopeptide (TPR) repeat protein